MKTNQQAATDLRGEILDFVAAVRKRPTIGSDPGELDRLETLALTSADGAYRALTAPAADETWEARTLFLGSATVSERVQVEVPYPVLIVGGYASVSVLTTGGNVIPTVDDIDVSIDLDLKDRKTSTDGTVTTIVGAQAARDGNFVTLGAVSQGQTRGTRLWLWRIPYAKGEIGIQFRWKQGAGVFRDTHVGLALFATPL